MTNARTLITLLPLLTACAADPVVQVRTEYVHPPAALMRPCPVPVYAGITWADLAGHAVVLQSRLEQCDADKTEMRALSE